MSFEKYGWFLCELLMPNAPKNPSFVAAFGNRISSFTGNSSQFSLSEINLEDTAFDPADLFYN